jgi:ABC-type transport system involved in Fe-S cluster assembly fused permease/ATPase subunit
MSKDLQSLLWLKITNRSQKIVSSKTLRHIFMLPEQHEIWAAGGFLSDFNKAVSLDACLEEVLFVLVPVTLDLLTTTIYVWTLLGTGYGLSTCIISLLYIYRVICTVRLSISWRRDTITSKRFKDAVAYVEHRKTVKAIYSDFSRKEILGSIVKILEDHAVEEEIARFERVQDVLQCQRLMAASSLFYRSIPPNAGFYLGFLVMSGCVVWQVRNHERTGTDLLPLFTFMEQLLTALSSLSSSLQRMQSV